MATEITETEWRDCYYIYRAMHDGVCPNCGHTSHMIAEDMTCYKCDFKMELEEITTILEHSQEILKRRLDSFQRVRATLAPRDPG